MLYHPYYVLLLLVTIIDSEIYLESEVELTLLLHATMTAIHLLSTLSIVYEIFFSIFISRPTIAGLHPFQE